ncbi:MAG: tyrosine--tRNA ligase [Bacteroidota bacterium]
MGNINFIEELTWRGLLQDAIPGTEEYLLAQPVSGYLGVDPTRDTIHIGNLVSVMMLVHLQRAGHKPFALVGGATAMVGDPSGRDSERQLMSVEQIQYNASCVKNQLAQFLDFDTKINPAEMVNNYDWLGQMGFLEFLRDVGKHMTISYMLGKESVKRRLEGGISYTEFAYQLLQGYDYYHLYKHKGVQIQVGGSDQWGNIVTGTELIRRIEGHEAKAFAAVCPLLTDEQGKKMGKTAGGKQIWLDPKQTSPYEFYQYWLGMGDPEAEKCIKIFTLKDRPTIEGIIEAHQQAPHLRQLQKELGEAITKRVHGESGLASALKLTEFLFNKNSKIDALKALSIEDWQEVVEVQDTLMLDKQKLEAGMNILDALTELGIVQSKSEGRRSIEKDQSIRINTEKCEGTDQTLTMEDVFHQRFLQLQKGKKRRYIIEVR